MELETLESSFFDKQTVSRSYLSQLYLYDEDEEPESSRESIQLNPSSLKDLFFPYFKKALKFQYNRILVADDEEFCLASMKALLCKAGIDTDCQVDFCITGKEAVNKVKEIYGLGAKYKLILTDFNMPVMNGIEATSKIKTFF